MHQQKSTKKLKKAFSKKLSKKLSTNMSSKVIVLVGLCLVLISLGYRLRGNNVLSFSSAPDYSNTSYVSSDVPASLSIPNRKISVDVTPATIQGGEWETSDDTASYLVQSSVPGKSGNTVIYAHNKDALFGNLQNADFGDVIQIRTNDGTIQKYEIRKKFIVSPDTIDAVQPTSYEVLTLFTCTGFADMKRLIIQAYPLS